MTELHQRLYRARDRHRRWISTTEGRVLIDPFFHEDHSEPRAYLDFHEMEWLIQIGDTGLAIEPEQMDVILQRHRRERRPSRNPSSEFGFDYYDEERAYQTDHRDTDADIDVVMSVCDEITRQGLAAERYFRVERPIYDHDTKLWFIPAVLTNRGQDAAWAGLHDLLYDRDNHEADYRESFARWEECLDEATFPGEATFKLIQGLRHHSYGPLRARIPETRQRLWREHFRRHRYPTNDDWDHIRPGAAVAPEVEDLQAQFTALHTASWIHALSRVDTLDHHLFKAVRELDPAVYPSVIPAYHEKACELWIAKVQACNSPNAPLWENVAKLDDTFGMVKAEAFLRKMQVWTPIDANGRRV